MAHSLSVVISETATMVKFMKQAVVGLLLLAAISAKKNNKQKKNKKNKAAYQDDYGYL